MMNVGSYGDSQSLSFFDPDDLIDDHSGINTRQPTDVGSSIGGLNSDVPSNSNSVQFNSSNNHLENKASVSIFFCTCS